MEYDSKLKSRSCTVSRTHPSSTSKDFSLWYFTLLFAVTIQNLCAQELVINGSFEAHGRCPEGFSAKAFRKVEQVNAFDGVPAYFHACSEDVGTPRNWAGNQLPKNGEAYAGLILTSRTGDRTDRQFVQLHLKEPLVNGLRYRLSFWVSPADASGYTTDRIGACFTTDVRPSKKGVAGLVGKPDVENPLDRFLADTASWMKVEGVFNAKGGERSVIIGNFQPYGFSSRKVLSSNSGASVLQNTKRKYAMMNDIDPARSAFQRTISQTAYVYLDEVSLQPLTTIEELDVLTQQDACADREIPVSGRELVPDVHFDSNGTGGSGSWSNASGGTPDLFDGRTGIYLYSDVDPDNREFIRTPLVEQTDPCATYRLNMRVLRDPSYGYAVDRIGIALVDQFQKGHERGPLPYATAWSSPSGLVMENASEWITFCGEVKDAGCATEMLIGNFSADSSTTVRRMDVDGGPFAYYFVDDVSLVRTGTAEGCTLNCDTVEIKAPSELAESEREKEDPVAVVPIRFAVSSHIPYAMDGALVARILSALERDPTAVIKIQGHTDNSGSEDRNNNLSRERAEAVERFLMDAGIPVQSLKVEYFGSARPITSNSTEKGRSVNRRVDVVVPEAVP